MSSSSRSSQPPLFPVAQPVDALQLSQLQVEWVPYQTLRPNRYNPNKMTTPERALLRQSILEDGWTQPIVTLLDGTIVDGEQRWTTAGLPVHPAEIAAIMAKMTERAREGYLVSTSILERLQRAHDRLETLVATGVTPLLADVTGKLIPITRVDFKDDAHKMISTIRHNRARGTHQLDAMSLITRDLQQLGLDFDDLETRLGMLPDEIERLTELAPLEDIPLDVPLSLSWEPVPIMSQSTEQLLADDRAELVRARSEAAALQAKTHAMDLARLDQERRTSLAARIAAEEAHGQALTQAEKDVLQRAVAQDLPTPPAPPAAPMLHKFTFFLTADEHALCAAVLGDPPVQGFLRLCREAAARLEVPHVPAVAVVA